MMLPITTQEGALFAGRPRQLRSDSIASVPTGHALLFRAIVYFLAIAGAEAVTVILNPVAGIAIYTALLLTIVLDAAISNRYFQSTFILSLGLIPLIRIVSLTLPLLQIPTIWWYPVIYTPLIAATATVAILLGYKREDIGITLRGWPLQLLVGLTGLGLGYVEHLIIQPEQMVNQLTWQAIWLPALILIVFTGFGEEFIFRGVMQTSAVASFEGWGIVYVSAIFAVMHLGWAVGPGAGPLAWLDMVFVFVVALFFGWIVKKTRSLLGVTTCHGLINVMLFILVPLIF